MGSSSLKVSVIITTCQRSVDILKTSIESVLNQTYSNIELIVVNDSPEYSGSNDIDLLMGKYTGRLIYLKNKTSLGANASRNKGASYATGEVLSFLDDDDYWDLHKVEYSIPYFSSGNQVVYSDIVFFKERYKKESVKGFCKKEQIIPTLLYNNYWGGFSNVLFSKDAFNAVGRLNEEVVSSQDVDLWLRLAQMCDINYINMPLTYYRVHSNSITLNKNKKTVGLFQLLDNYKFLFDTFPDSRRKKLGNEYVQFLKNGWFEDSKLIRKELKKYNYSYLGFFIIGYIKHLLVKIQTMIYGEV